MLDQSLAEQPQNEPSIKIPPCAAKTPKDEALRPNISTSILDIETSTSFLKKRSTAPAVNTPPVKIPKVNSKDPLPLGSRRL